MKGFGISTPIAAAALCVLTPLPAAADTIGPLLEEGLPLSVE